MSLPFFKALNPTSTESGINYNLAQKHFIIQRRYPFPTSQADRIFMSHIEPKDEREIGTIPFPCQGKEMIDATLAESINKAIHSDFNVIEGIVATFNIIVGGHYDVNAVGRNNCKGGAKGVLDFLILPLLARKLIADTLEPDHTSRLLNILAWTVALPIEIARISAGLALTVLLAPIVALVHAIKDITPNHGPDQDAPPHGSEPQYLQTEMTTVTVSVN